MGQQQLLLVILVTILVGIATVVALNVFGTAAEDANRDAVRQDLLIGATTAQAVYTRPRILDGAGGNFSTVEDNLLQRLGMPIRQNADETWGNENGIYFIESVTQHGFVLRGRPASGGADILATITRDTDNRTWNIEMNDDTE